MNHEPLFYPHLEINKKNICLKDFPVVKNLQTFPWKGDDMKGSVLHIHRI